MIVGSQAWRLVLRFRRCAFALRKLAGIFPGAPALQR